MRTSFIALVPHAFGDHKKCEETQIELSKWLQNPDTFSRNDLPKGKDLKGENLNENLPKLFKYTRVTLLLTNLWKMPPRKAMKAYTVQ